MIQNFQMVMHAYPWFFRVVAAVFGACIGSFLNVVIYRLPAKRSIVFPGSQCACGSPIAWYDNVPVLSWLILRGRARCCGRRFSARYPAVELLTAGLFLATWMQYPPAVAVGYWLFLSCLVCATFIDLDTMEIPDAFTIWLGIAGVGLSFLVPSLHGQSGGPPAIDMLRSAAASIVGLVAGSGMILWIALTAETLLRKEAMGFGDVKLLGAIGAFCGWRGAAFSIFGGAAVGCVWLALSAALRACTRGRISLAPRAETAEGVPTELGLGVHVPFGPMLAVAAGLYLLVFRRPVDAWVGQILELF
jgi:leader peptidase (prepilin peptidase)/N-methyltransferase